MKRIIPIIAFCGALLNLTGCATKPEPIIEKAEEIKYDFNFDNSEDSSFLLTLIRNNFSLEFNPCLIGDENSIGFFKISDWKAENNFVNISINLYHDDIEDSVFYDTQIHVVKPTFEARINKKFIEDEEKLVPFESWYVRGFEYGKQIEIFDENGDGNLESIIYDDKQIGPLSNKEFKIYGNLNLPCEKLKGIISKGYELYFKCMEEINELGLGSKQSL